MNLMGTVKEKSSLLHGTAESTGYIKKLVDGNATVEGYAEYILNLHAVYEAIENALDTNESNANVKPLVTKELYRAKLIKKDIDALLGEKATSLSLLASTEAYVARIKELSNKTPELVIAHAYTRFLADLFGGRVFFALLNEKYGIGNEALNYYASPDSIKDIREYVMGYHGKVNAAIPAELQNDFINEVNNSYVYNIAISTELDFKLNK